MVFTIPRREYSGYAKAAFEDHVASRESELQNDLPSPADLFAQHVASRAGELATDLPPPPTFESAQTQPGAQWGAGFENTPPADPVNNSVNIASDSGQPAEQSVSPILDSPNAVIEQSSNPETATGPDAAAAFMDHVNARQQADGMARPTSHQVSTDRVTHPGVGNRSIGDTLGDVAANVGHALSEAVNPTPAPSEDTIAPADRSYPMGIEGLGQRLRTWAANLKPEGDNVAALRELPQIIIDAATSGLGRDPQGNDLPGADVARGAAGMVLGGPPEKAAAEGVVEAAPKIADAVGAAKRGVTDLLDNGATTLGAAVQKAAPFVRSAIGGAVASGSEAASEGADPGAVAGAAAEGAAYAAGRRLLPKGGSVLRNRMGIAEEVGRYLGPIKPTEEAAATVGENAGKVKATAEQSADFAGNIRLPKYSEPVRQILQSVHDSDPTAFEDARRGVIDNATLQDLAQQAGQDIRKVAQQWKPGSAANAETALALRQALAQQANVVKTAQEAYRAADSTENFATLMEALTTHRALQETVSGVTAEAGRVLNQFRIAVTPEDRIAATLGRLATKWGGRMDQGALANELKRWLADPSIDLNDPVQVAKMAREMYRPKAVDFVDWYMYTWRLLSSPIGRIRDTAASLVQTLQNPIETAAAVPFDAIASKLRGTQRAVRLEEVPAEYQGMWAALGDGWRDAFGTLANGYASGALRTDLEHAATREPVPGVLANLPTRLITANDAFFRTINKNASLWAQAARQAKNEGLKGQAFADRLAELRTNPTDAMLAEMEATAKYRVLQDDGALSKGISALKNAPGLGPFLRWFVIPFHGTAINLAKWAMERSPLGFAQWAGRAALGGKVGIPSMTQRDSSLLLGRASMGTLLFAGAGKMAMDGNLTGAAPQDPALRDAFYRQGKQPYSVKVGEHWFSYQWLPHAPVLAAAATVAKAYQAGEVTDALAAGGIMTAAAAKALMDQPMLQGVASWVMALDDPERYGPNFGENMAKGVTVPAVLQWAARATDGVIRDPDGAGEAIASVIPGLSATVPAKLDQFGNDSTRPAEQLWAGSLNPLKASADRQDPVEAELAKLAQKYPDLHVEPNGRYNTLSVQLTKKLSQGIDLERPEKREYQRLAGQLAYGELAQEIQNPGWARLSDDDKIAEIDQIMKVTRREAAAMLTDRLDRSGTLDSRVEVAAAKKAS